MTVCGKCFADLTSEPYQLDAFKCGSSVRQDGTLDQSHLCRARELEAVVEVLKAENAKLKARVEELERLYEHEPDDPLPHSVDCTCGDTNCPGFFLNRGR